LIKKSLLDKMIEEYNKYHGLEAHAEVLRQKQSGKGKGHLLVRFEGPFCLSCAPDEYYTDFQVLLEEATGLKLKINSVRQESNGAVVHFEYAKGDQATVYLSHF